MRLIRFFTPPDPWKFPVLILMAIFVGMGAYILQISRFTSYMGDDPSTCVNCHIMAPQYATWTHSSHREVATCNDCHVPHQNAFLKYYFKAKDGMRHAAMFTLRLEPQVIFIKEEGKQVVQDNCMRCHQDLVNPLQTTMKSEKVMHHHQDRFCWECHRETPHGRVNSLSSVPNARVPLPESPVPDWLKEETSTN